MRIYMYARLCVVRVPLCRMAGQPPFGRLTMATRAVSDYSSLRGPTWSIMIRCANAIVEVVAVCVCQCVCMRACVWVCMSVDVYVRASVWWAELAKRG